jgi:hypothetical protein
MRKSEPGRGEAIHEGRAAYLRESGKRPRIVHRAGDGS